MGGFTPQIPGIKIQDPILKKSFQREINEMIGRNNDSFPGSQPVSFATRHLEELRERDYFLCEKTDGVRCLLFLTNDFRDGQEVEVVYLVDRKNDFYWVPDVHIPTPRGHGTFYTRTLMDGELVLDEQPDGIMYADGKTRRLHYLLFDCLVYDGKNMVERDLESRLGHMHTIFPPYKDFCHKFPEDVRNHTFLLKKKAVHMSYAFDDFFKSIIPQLKHGNDGLIFTCVHSPYKPGTDDRLLKWKYPEENSVDFVLSLDIPDLESQDRPSNSHSSPPPEKDYDVIPRLILYVAEGSNHYRYWADLYVTSDDWDKMREWAEQNHKGLDESIVECVMDSEKRWRFLRFREDKKDGNFINTVNSVIESIEDPVNKQDLLNAANGIRHAWKERHATR